MSDFMITFSFFGLLAIPSIILFISCGATIKNKIGGAIAVIIFWLMISGALWAEEKGNEERWNGGYCECGAHWELAAVSESRNGFDTKYYTCPDCYKEIEIK